MWQDFLFACAAYPEEEPFPVGGDRRRRRDNVTRLMPHPSLAHLERLQREHLGLSGLGLERPMVGDRTWGAGYYVDILPGNCCGIGSGAFLLSGEPVFRFAGSSRQLRFGWTAPPSGIVWNDLDYTVYASYVPAISPQNSATRRRRRSTTLRRSISDRATGSGFAGNAPPPESRRRKRESSPGAPQRICRPPTDFDDWLYLMFRPAGRGQSGSGWSICARTVGVCMGSVVWQLNDCWPVTSWAAIDGDGRQQAPLVRVARRLRRPAADRPAAGDDALEVFGVNDSRDEWDETLTIERDHVRRGGAGLAHDSAHGRRVLAQYLARHSVGRHHRRRFARPNSWLFGPASGGGGPTFLRGGQGVWSCPDPDLRVEVAALTGTLRTIFSCTCHRSGSARCAASGSAAPGRRVGRRVW